METVTTYEQERIRVYGIHTRAGLSLCRLGVPQAGMAAWGVFLRNLEEQTAPLLMTQVLPGKDGFLENFLLVRPESASQVIRVLDEKTAKEPETVFSVQAPVEQIHFHGPHFGDRYGIARTAIQCLEANGLPYLVAGCAGTSVQIVVPENAASRAVERLSEVFIKPGKD